MAAVGMFSDPFDPAPRVHVANLRWKRVLNEQGGRTPAKRLETGAGASSLNTDLLICEVCNKNFSRLSALKRHKHTAHEFPTQHRCYVPGCGQSFARKDTLKRHTATHVKSGYIKCLGCGMSFRKDYFKEHVLAKRNDNCRIANDGLFERLPEYMVPADAMSTDAHTVVPNANKTAAESAGFTAVSTAAPGYHGAPPPLPARKASMGDGARNSEVDFVYESPETYHPTSIVDPIFFQQNEEEMSATRIMMERHSREWENLQSRVAQQPAHELSSVSQQVSLLIRRDLRYPVHVAFTRAGKCVICNQYLERHQHAVLHHAKSHLIDPPKPLHACDCCKIDFVYSQDLAGHQQRKGECQSMLDDDATNWLTSAVRDKFISDLRLWETAQLYFFLQSFVDSQRKGVPRPVKNLNSVPTLRRRSASMDLKYGARNLRSCSSNLRYSDMSSAKELTHELSMLFLTEEVGDESNESNATPVKSGEPQDREACERTATDVVLEQNARGVFLQQLTTRKPEIEDLTANSTIKARENSEVSDESNATLMKSGEPQDGEACERPATDIVLQQLATSEQVIEDLNANSNMNAPENTEVSAESNATVIESGEAQHKEPCERPTINVVLPQLTTNEPVIEDLTANSTTKAREDTAGKPPVQTKPLTEATQNVILPDNYTESEVERLVPAIEKGDIALMTSILEYLDEIVFADSVAAKNFPSQSTLCEALAFALSEYKWEAAETLLKWAGKHECGDPLFGGSITYLMGAQHGFIWAAQQGRLFIIEELLKIGLLVHAVHGTRGVSLGEWALLGAAAGGHDSIVALLLASGISPDASLPSGSTALMEACIHGHLGVVKLLVKAGADMNQIGPLGATSWSHANRFGHRRVAEFLKANECRLTDESSANIGERDELSSLFNT